MRMVRRKVKMKTLILTLVILLILSGPALAEWTDFQKNLALSYGSFIAIDLVQSRHWIEHTPEDPLITDYGYLYEANNFVAGKSIEEAALMALGANYLLYKFVDSIESEYRTAILVAANIIEFSVIRGNHKAMQRHGLDYELSFGITF